MTTLQGKDWVSIQGEKIEDSKVKKVSVVVPNYNYARYIKKRMKTILGQTYPIYELIVLDDASTDGSADAVRGLVSALESENPQAKIKFVPNRKNSGKAMAQWRKGFELATGDYVWIAEADDLSRRRFLEEVMKGFDDSEVVMSYTESMVINGGGVIIAPNFRWSRDKEKTGHYRRSYIKEGRQEIEEIMAIRCTVPNVSAVVFRNNRKLVKYLDEALKYTQVGDWYFYMKVLGEGRISYRHKALNMFRVHKGSVTSNAKKARRHWKEIKKMHEIFKQNYNLSEEMLERMDVEERRVEERMERSMG